MKIYAYQTNPVDFWEGSYSLEQLADLPTDWQEKDNFRELLTAFWGAAKPLGLSLIHI